MMKPQHAPGGDPLLHDFHDRFLWRVAGFPLEALEDLSLPAIAQGIQSAYPAYPDETWPTWRKRVAADAHLSDLRAEFQSDFRGVRERLAKCARSAEFQDAVAQSSPDAAERLLRTVPRDTPRRSTEKRAELLAIRYLQRFVTKCETAGPVGPVILGAIGSLRRPVTYSLDFRHARSVVFPSTRLLDGIASNLRQRVAVLVGLRFRRMSGCSLVGDVGVVRPGVGILAVGAETLTVLKACSRETTLRDVGRCIGVVPESLAQTLFALHRVGLVSDELDDLHNDVRPVATLNSLMARFGSVVPPDLKSLISALATAADRWPRESARGRARIVADLASFGRPLGISVVRRGGRFFGDHLPLSQDELLLESYLHLDREWASPLLADLKGVLTNKFVTDVKDRLVASDATATTFSPSRKRVPLSEILADRTTWSHRKGPTQVATWTGPVITSPDVMIASPDVESLCAGRYRAVLSEAHASIGCAGFPIRGHPDAKSWLKSVSTFLSRQLSPRSPFVLAEAARNKTSFLGPLDGIYYLELTAPCPQGMRRLDVANIDFVPGNGAALLQDRNTGVALLALPSGSAQDAGGVLEWLAPRRFLRPIGGSEPQMTGRVTYSRRSWRLTRGELPSRGAEPFEVFQWAQWMRVSNRMPRWIFIHPPADTKPICVDFANPLLCEELLRQTRRAEEMAAVEMDPGPEDAWVVSERGRHLSELRMLYAAPT
jgi:hypothetical protein